MPNSNNEIKLNLGCGTDIKEGYVNIDMYGGNGVDVVCAIEELDDYNENEVTKALKDLAENKFEFVECEIEFEKKTIEEIEELSKNIDTNKAADEVIQWLVDNVSNYIDNKEKEFRIDLVID